MVVLGNDFLSVGGLSGTSSLLGAAGDDTLMVAGAATQWYADAGEGDDSLSIAGAVQRTTVLAGAGADTLQIGSMSKTSVSGGSGNDSIVVAGTAITSTLRAGAGDDLISISGGITDWFSVWRRWQRQLHSHWWCCYWLSTPDRVLTLVLLGAAADTITLTGALTSTSVTAGSWC